jgi:geranylgeranyl reductase family protein
MSKIFEYDVVVIGGGPAGSTAGRLLKNFGFKVLIIDKSKFPRQKLCAGCISDKTIKLLERVFGVTINDLKRENVINFESEHYEIFYKDRLISKRNMNIPFYFVERCTYDNFLLNNSRDAGAEVIDGEGVVSFDIAENLIKTSTGRELKARFIIGADGINSTMRRYFPDNRFNRKSWQNNLGTGLEIFIDRSEMQKAINHPIIYFDYIDYGYSWVFPNRDKLIVGIGGLTQKNKKRLLPLFHKFLLAIKMDKFRTTRVKGYTFPYGNFLSEPVYKNIILVGDAAGFADPLLGEGIFYAQRSAEFASQAICMAMKDGKKADKDPEKEIKRMYLQLLQKYIYPEFTYAKKTRNFMFTYLNKFKHYPFKILLYMLGEKSAETVHGIRSYKSL